MTKVCINFDNSVQLALSADRSLVAYDELDYSTSLLDQLFSRMEGKGIERITVVVPCLFSHAIYKGSASFGLLNLQDMPGYYCMDLDVIEKLHHLAESLGVSEIRFCTPLDVMKAYSSTACFIDSQSGLISLIVVNGGRPAVISYCTEKMLGEKLCKAVNLYRLQDVVNLTTIKDINLVLEQYSNVFAITDQHVLNRLTWMSIAEKADTFTFEDVMQKALYEGNIPSDTGDTHSTLDETGCHVYRECTGEKAQLEPCTANQELDLKKSDLKKQSLKKPGLKKQGIQDRGKGRISALDAARRTVEKEKKSSRHQVFMIAGFLALTVVLLSMTALTFLQANISQQLKEQAAAVNARAQVSLNQLQSQLTLVNTAEEDNGNPASLLSAIDDLKLADDSSGSKICSVTIQDGTLCMRIFFKDKAVYKKLIKRISKFYMLVSDHTGDISADGFYRDITLAVPV